MKRILIALLTLLIVGCGKDEFIEGQFAMSVDADHPIWEMWLQDVEEGEREELKKEVMKEVESITYVFIKDSSYHVLMFSSNHVKNVPDDNSEELKKIVLDGQVMYQGISDEEAFFRFENGNAYVLHQNKPVYEILLTRK